jgi:hypothetical protein
VRVFRPIHAEYRQTAHTLADHALWSSRHLEARTKPGGFS